MVNSLDPGVLESFRDAVGQDHVLTDPDLIAGYLLDWTGRWTGKAPAVIRPGSTVEVQEVVRVCHASGIPLVPQGGNTGLVGGSVPHHGEVVLSLRRLDRLEPVDLPSRSVVAGAGVTLGRLQSHAREVGLEYGVDMASRDSATVGGTIATNAGGMHVVAHGDTRQQVLRLEVVLAEGSVVQGLDRLPKVSNGPDPLGLIVGSEGTLGIVTAARLRLLPVERGESLVVLMAMDRLADGLDLIGPGIRAIEFFDSACMEAVAAHRGLSRPLPDAPFYLLIESTATPDLSEDTAAVVDRGLWVYRESITETLNQIGVPTKLDVAVPLNMLDSFSSAVRDLDIEGRVFLFGHLAEGNFHVNVVDAKNPERVVDLVLKAVRECDGAIAGEHGIGVAKTAWWQRLTDPEVVSVHRRMKSALDPKGILNPAVFWGD